MKSAARVSGPNLRVVGAPRAGSPRRPLGVLGEVRLACHPKNRLAALLGGLLGGGVPVASYWLAHHELSRGPLVWVLVGGGLVFSALTVVRWGVHAFGSAVKAVGFTVLLEGVLVGSATPWLALGALAYLVAINAVATGTQLALGGRRR